jgi:hypothetical protein
MRRRETREGRGEGVVVGAFGHCCGLCGRLVGSKKGLDNGIWTGTLEWGLQGWKEGSFVSCCGYDRSCEVKQPKEVEQTGWAESTG